MHCETAHVVHRNKRNLLLSAVGKSRSIRDINHCSLHTDPGIGLCVQSVIKKLKTLLEEFHELLGEFEGRG